MITIAAALDAYAAERRPVVIDVDRLTRSAAKMAEIIGMTDAADRAALAAAVVTYREARRVHVTDSTIRRDLIVLRAAVNRAWKLGDIAYQPYVALPTAAPSRHRWLSAAEAQRLLRCCPARLYLFVLLALATAARRAAILDLTWDRVDLRRAIIDFRAPHPQAARRKKRAIVPMSALLARELAAARRRANEERVVPLSRTAVEQMMREAAADADLPGVTAHVLRHTAATWLLGEGQLPLAITSAMLGHQSTTTTEQVYAHLITSHLTPAADLLGDMLT